MTTKQLFNSLLSNKIELGPVDPVIASAFVTSHTRKFGQLSAQKPESHR